MRRDIYMWLLHTTAEPERAKELQYIGKREDLIQCVEDSTAHAQKYSLDSYQEFGRRSAGNASRFEAGLGATIDGIETNEVPGARRDATEA